MAGEKSVRLFLLGDNKDAKAKLDEIDLKADELAAKHPELKIGIDSAAAQAKLMLLREELKSSIGEGKGGFLSSLNTGITGLLSKIPLLGNSLSGMSQSLSSVAGEGGSAASELVGIASSGVGLVAVVGVVASLAVEVGALATGAVAAGAGIGALAIFALPTLKEIFKDVNKTGAAFNKLPESVKQGIGYFRQLRSEFDKISGAIKPQVMQVFAQAMKDAAGFLPMLMPLAKSALGGISQSLSMITNALHGPMLKSFMTQMTQLSGPVIKAVVSGLIGVAGDMARLMSTFSKKDVLTAIAIAFRVVGAALNILTAIIKVSMGTFDFLTQVIRFNGHEFDVIGVTVARVARGIYRAVTGDIGSVVSFFRGLPGRIVSALGNLGGLLLSAGKSLITGLITGIENAVPGLHSALSWVTSIIPSWKGPASLDRELLYGSGQLIMGGLVRGIQDGTNGPLRSQLMNTTGVIANTKVSGAIAGSGGGIAVEVNFSADGDQALITALKKTVRVRGGNPSIFGR